MKSDSLAVFALAAVVGFVAPFAHGAAGSDSARAGEKRGGPTDTAEGFDPPGGRFGVALNLSRADVRYELDPYNAVGGHLGIEIFGGGFKSHDFGFGGYFLRRIVRPDPVGLHYMGGISVEAFDDGLTEEYTQINVYAGLGVEYFLPGTRQLSFEASVGVALMSRDRKIKETIGGAGDIKRGAGLSIKDLTGGLVMIRYYFD